MLKQISREAQRVPIGHAAPPHTQNLLPLPERRLVQASSLIHVFIYYFIGCV